VKTLLLFLILAVAMPASSSAFWFSSKPPAPPVAKKIPHPQTVHGHDLTDDYFWMREKTNRAVLAHLKAENAYTDAVMKPTKRLQESLFKEMVARIKETDQSAPARDGDWWYYTRTEKGKQYAYYCRKFRDLKAKEEIVLDLNRLARGHKYLGTGDSDISDDHNLVAYTLDFTGFRQYTLFIKDLRTGKVLPERREKVGSVAWAADNRTLFYTVEDEAKRQYRVYRHRLGDEKDELIYEEKDELYDVHVERSHSDEYLFIGATSKTTTEYRFLRANTPYGQWQLLAPRKQDHEYYPEHHDTRFFLRSNRDGRNFAILATPADKPLPPARWQIVVPHDPKIMRMGLEMFADFHVLHEREDGLPQLRVTDLRSGASHRIAMPETTYDVSPETNLEYDTQLFRFDYQSLVTPRSVFEYDMGSRNVTLLKRQEVLSGYNPDDYATQRLFATAPDGTRVPISIVYKKTTARDGSAPLLLDGYGAYGIPNEADFSTVRLSLLNRGYLYAIAHIRGGGELGKPWHDAGRMQHKRNTFTDFIACADYLVTQKITSRDRLAITGGSAGGMLIGAVLNLRPDLFNLAILQVPFVDVINTMLDEDLPLTVTEFEEWGNPKKRAEFDTMFSYSPYDNLAAKAYPTILVETSFHDSQVMYWEPAKYVAKLRALKTDTNPLLFRCNMNAGHSGASGRYDYLKEIAFTYAFLLTYNR
jgi:oligopeptidase B